LPYYSPLNCLRSRPTPTPTPRTCYPSPPYLKAGDKPVRLRASKGKEGEGKEGIAVVLTVLFGPIGLLKHGKQIEVKEGTPVTAYVDEDAEFATSSTSMM
jgi:hypothetical protein